MDTGSWATLGTRKTEKRIKNMNYQLLLTVNMRKRKKEFLNLWSSSPTQPPAPHPKDRSTTEFMCFQMSKI